MITVDVTVTSGLRTIPAAAIRAAVAHVCKRERVRNAEFSFVVVNDRMIRSINKRFLKHDFVTDIITFPLEEGTVSAEIYIGAEEMRRQAKANGVSVRNEMTRLVVHGVLHALGYDDRSAAKKREMFTVQERYVTEVCSQQ